MSRRRPERIAHLIEAWFRENARDLPWRTSLGSPRDPYHALVCEAMAQQTQISRVAERFVTFIDRFPTVHSLANAAEDDVLALWSGLGYYRRAKNLRAAAIAVVSKFDGTFPTDPSALAQLPGIGPYTAGAIASVALEQRCPAVDGNVIRVLARLEGIDEPPTESQVRRRIEQFAQQLADTCQHPGVLNEGLMEFGATVCTPRNPACLGCPLSRSCRARRANTQDRIPVKKPAVAKRPLYCASARVTRPDGCILVEQRPDEGMWASMWQAPTLERHDRPPTGDELAKAIGVPLSRDPAVTFQHKTTHRDVRFDVFESHGNHEITRGRWRAATEVSMLALSRPQRMILIAS